MLIETTKQLASVIDHTLLSPTAVNSDIRRICEEAMRHSFYAVCVNPRWVSLAADVLAGTGVKVASVVSFPLGADSTASKVSEAKEVIYAGADEIDVVVDLAAVIRFDQVYLRDQVFSLLKACRVMHPPVILKLIIESAALNYDQKSFICRLCDELRVDFVKTSTGLHQAGGATLEDVAIIKQYAPNCKIKASGGIKTAVQALDFLSAGVDRIGTSSGIAILEQFSAGIEKGTQGE